MFKRRRPRSYAQMAGEFVYPRGGWTRALRYMVYRLRRLPDPAHKISRGIAAGVFTSFTPFFGFHFAVAASLAWLLRGNILAALLATFVGNPVTFPIIAGSSVELGSWLLGLEHTIPLHQTFAAFSNVSVELWHNLRAPFTEATASWDRLGDFMGRVFLPYLVGGLIPGIISAVIAYFASRPIISAYQKSRIKRLKKKFAKRREAAQLEGAMGPAPEQGEAAVLAPLSPSQSRPGPARPALAKGGIAKVALNKTGPRVKPGH